MNSRKFLLLIASILFVIVYFNIGKPKEWLDERILVFNQEIYDHMEHMSIEDRKLMKWGNPYSACISIKDYIKKEKMKDVLVLMPPPSYAKKFTQNVVLPEPVVCYLFAGLHTTSVESKDVYKANYCVVSVNGNMSFNKLKDRTAITNMVNEYKSVK